MTERTISRRSFIKLFIQLSGVALLAGPQLVAANVAEAASDCPAYGEGPYSAGLYGNGAECNPEYTSFLPIILK